MRYPAISTATLVFILLVVLPLGCGGNNDVAPSELVKEGSELAPLDITSEAFAAGGPIPGKYTCDGEDGVKDVSPPLAWSEPPAGTRSFALICDDPDAPRGTWVHWVIYNIPEQTRSLPEGMALEAEPGSGMLNGKNSWGKLGYRGPCPPGGTHRYFFKLYALDTVLDLEPGAGKKDLLNAMKGHVLAEGELMGTYHKQ